MQILATNEEARLTYLKRELVKSVTRWRYFNQNTCSYSPPTRAILARVKRLLKEIQELEKVSAIDKAN